MVTLVPRQFFRARRHLAPEKKEKKEGEEEEKLDGDAEMEDGDAGAAAAEGEDAPMEEDAKPAAGSAEDLD